MYRKVEHVPEIGCGHPVLYEELHRLVDDGTSSPMCGEAVIDRLRNIMKKSS